MSTEKDVEVGPGPEPVSTPSKWRYFFMGLLGFFCGALILGLAVGLKKKKMGDFDGFSGGKDYGKEETLGDVYMSEMIKVSDYDNSEDSLHFDPMPTWGNDVEASRVFRTLESGGAYSYRNKVR